MKTNLNFLDLFAGAGGLSEGFIRSGFFPVAHVEADPAACFTLKTRVAFHWLRLQGRHREYNSYLTGDISRSELYSLIPGNRISSVINAEISKESLRGIFRKIDELLDGKRLDLIIGGPPCQAYSNIGRSVDKNRMQGDRRNYFYQYYSEFLRRYRPSFFVFENVKGLLSAEDEYASLYFDLMRNAFRNAGYETEYKVLNAENHGVLQKRERIILVGRRGKSSGFYPEPEPWTPGVNVDEVFTDLPPLQAGEGSLRSCEAGEYTGSYLYKAGVKDDICPVTGHQSRPNNRNDLDIYKIAADLWSKGHKRLNYNDLPVHLKKHKNENSFTDRFKVVAGDLPSSHTVVAHIAKDGHYYIHPDSRQNRSLTPREAARLQTFPDNYFFESTSGALSRTPAFRQIGNAVPVLLAQKIAEKLKEVW